MSQENPEAGRSIEERGPTGRVSSLWRDEAGAFASPRLSERLVRRSTDECVSSPAGVSGARAETPACRAKGKRDAGD